MLRSGPRLSRRLLRLRPLFHHTSPSPFLHLLTPPLLLNPTARQRQPRATLPTMQRHCIHAALLLAVVATSAVAPTPSAAQNRTANCSLVAPPDAGVIRVAFEDVANFPLPRALGGWRACRPVRRLTYPSRNLTGVVRWAALGNLSGLLTIDLSGNSLEGDGFGGGLWRAPLLRAVDVSRNRLGGALRLEPSAAMASFNVSGNGFTSVDGVDALAGLEVLDVSRNRVSAMLEGLRRLTKIKRLDLSRNSMAGRFPDDLPPLDGVEFLDISDNNFSGVVNSTWLTKFGRSAFLRAGNASLVIEDSSPAPAPAPATTTPSSGGKKHKRVVLIVVVVVVCAVVTMGALAFLFGCVACGFNRRRKRGKKPAVWEDDEVAVGAVKVAATAPVVLFERPLMKLTLADLAAATSGFGRESQLADVGGRSGAVYRAVLPGDLHVVVRVVDGAVAGAGGEGDDDDPAMAAAGLRELARLRHPNILPLLGYCIAGKEKLLLYEYMEKGDLHRWLHELPTSSMDMDDTAGGDMWDTTEQGRKLAGDWATRHRIMLGIARGLAFLHQGWAGGSSSGRPIVHGHLVPTNVLLTDDLEPRISDYTHPGGGAGGETPEGDVYGFGVLVFELVTGQVRWDESTVSWARGVIRNRKGINIVDARLRDGEEEEEGGINGGAAAEREMVECLQVGFLCTAHSPEKRPSMQQVVGLLKDIRPEPLPPPPAAADADETP
ncbi:calmodulin-binding receptor kinase CaMRLK-like [Oryza brachyantha]|uniref:calmodulin-binding receptor kinase CaMRLK-like n=1 Tax=Oryza brachyantha TaxID=4533 RepID=UPI001ADA564F|nr:calmodulin-binding receptor kinase CaMRLK-like [Oryza brachyantha]